MKGLYTFLLLALVLAPASCYLPSILLRTAPKEGLTQCSASLSRRGFVFGAAVTGLAGQALADPTGDDTPEQEYSDPPPCREYCLDFCLSVYKKNLKQCRADCDKECEGQP